MKCFENLSNVYRFLDFSENLIDKEGKTSDFSGKEESISDINEKTYAEVIYGKQA